MLSAAENVSLYGSLSKLNNHYVHFFYAIHTFHRITMNQYSLEGRLPLENYWWGPLPPAVPIYSYAMLSSGVRWMGVADYWPLYTLCNVMFYIG